MTFDQKQIGTVYVAFLFLCLFPFITPSIALATGIFLAILGFKNIGLAKYTSFTLKASIVLMGFGMNLTHVIGASKTGFAETVISVSFVLISGLILVRLLKVDSKIGILITSGTAICGGSAIAAVAPIINAKEYQISFSLAIIFILNAIALFIFPIIGNYFHLSQEIFGNWAAIAIHDTSSVVGAGATYGAKALEVATTVKLIRALWIIPLSLFISFIQKDKESGKVKIPWFIGLFVAGILIVYLLPGGAGTYDNLNWLGKRGMVIALFLIGSNMSFSEVKKAGWRSFILGIALWLLIAISSFIMLALKY